MKECLMKPQILGLRFAGTIFGIMSLAQLVRLVTGLEVIAAGYVIPLWISAPAFIFLVALSLWMWRLSNR